MAPRTIAQRAAAGEIQSVQGLTREEQGELLVWARQQGVQYQEIIDRYGFTLSSEGLRTWHRNMVLNHPDRVPTFNATDVGLFTLLPRTITTTPPTVTTIQLEPPFPLFLQGKYTDINICNIGPSAPTRCRALRGGPARQSEEPLRHLGQGQGVQ